jgi:CheY-like chemotaxis protein
VFEDNGPGIPPEIVERVFDPFFTTKEVGKGSGLGLSMVYGFVHQSAGHVRVESAVNAGTQVHLYLPRMEMALDVESETPETSETSEAHAIPRGSGERVLIVEDDPHIARLGKELLTELGYDPVSASQASVAVGLLQRDRSVQVLFTDVVLPGGLSGLDLAKAARAMRPDLRILFTTGYTEHERMSRSLIEERALLLKKPYQIAELADRLHQLLREPRPA